MAVPIGVLTAIYLEEYANKERWYNRLLELNIQNLAAVPAIVYGILGLAFIVRGPVGIGRVLLAGAIILTLVVLPTVIIASREAIRAVPDSIRQGGFALGATKWQVVSRQVLPASIPGIATGSILALSRAVGETAPLLLIGALQYVAFDPTVLGAFTALPGADLHVGQAAGSGVPDACRRGDHRAARDRADHERARDLPPQPLPTDVVRIEMTQKMDEQTPDSDAALPETHARMNETPRIDSARIAEIVASAATTEELATREKVFHVEDLAVAYSRQARASDVSLDVYENTRDGVHRPVRLREVDVHPLLQPHERPDHRREGDGTVHYHGNDLYGASVDPVEVRRRIGMVFQKPNPFPKSIYDNVAFGPRVLGMKEDLDERVERCLRRAALWDEVKDRLKDSRARALGRSAAAALHRASARDRAGRDPDGRAGIGARPDRDGARSRI